MDKQTHFWARKIFILKNVIREKKVESKLVGRTDKARPIPFFPNENALQKNQPLIFHESWISLDLENPAKKNRFIKELRDETDVKLEKQKNSF